MHATASYIQQPNVYPSFLSYPRHHHYLDDSIRANTSSTHYSTGLDLSNNIKQIDSDGEDDNESSSPSFDDQTNSSLIPRRKRPRIVPIQEKDASYYEKRERNNESAKRSRDTRRANEQNIQERVDFLQHENSRLSMENQTIRYQISQLHAIYSGISKPLQ
jgi:hypothetical protein